MGRRSVVAIAAATAFAWVGGATATASPGGGPTAIVALGDSFISGEGGRWLGNGSAPYGTRSGTDRAAVECDERGRCRYEPRRVYGDSEQSRCHRSDVAPILSAPAPVALKVNLACSGAKAVNLLPSAIGGQPHFGEPPQADALAAVAAHDDVRVVVVTVGANDAGFGELVAGCGLDWARSSPDDPILCRDGAERKLAAALPQVRAGLSRVLAAIRSTMASAGYRRTDYRLVAMGYASPLPAARWLRYPQSSGWERLDLGGCPFWDADANWAAGEGTGTIVTAMHAAATREGAELLDVRHAFDGHQLCDSRSNLVGAAGPSPAGAEWVRRLELGEGSPRESLHPNAYGQRALGACIGLLYASPIGDYACRLMPGRTYVDGIRLRPLQ